MSLKTKATSSKDFDAELAPAGQHVAVCIAVIDLGTHTETFQGQDPKDAHKIFLAWELTAESTRPVVGMGFTLSLHTKSKLRAWLKNWSGGKDLSDGQEFDVTKLAGLACQLTIEHKQSGDRTFSNIANLTGLAKGMNAPKAEKPTVIFDIDGGKTPAFEDWMPRLYGKTVEEWILESHEKGGKKAAPPAAGTQTPATQQGGQIPQQPAQDAFEQAGIPF